MRRMQSLGPSASRPQCPHAAGGRRARRHRLLNVELLESRRMLAALPTTTLDVPGDGFLGEPVTINVGFANSSPSDTGYGPFVDLILPAPGADGAGGATDDGITFSQARYLGQSLAATSLYFDALGQATHPLARDSSGSPVVVSGTPGYQLVVIALPLVSYAPGQPAAEIEATLLISPLADPGVPLPIQARGGFARGNDPLNNPTTDPSLLESPLHGGTLVPTVYRLTKSFSELEDETATGPNYLCQYTVTVDVPAGVTLNALALTDMLPASMQFVAVDSTSVHGVLAVADAVATPSTTVPGGTLTRQFPSVTGTSGTDDASMTFTFYVPRVDANGIDVLDPNAGGSVDADNQALSTAQWTPTDPRDPSIPVSVATSGPEHTLHERSLAIEKTMALITDHGAAGPTPGDTVEYQLTFRISDYFSIGDLVVTDVLSDGQRFDPSFPPAFSASDRAGSIATSLVDGAIGSAFYLDLSQIGNDADPATDGSTRLVFDVSRALVDAGAADGILQGGHAIAPDADPAWGTVTFRAVIQDKFSDTYLPESACVSSGDALSSHVTVDGIVRANDDLGTTLGAQQDTSDWEFAIAVGTLTKTIYAVNGNTAVTSPVQVASGDMVTFRIVYELPVADVDGLELVDHLPKSVLDATTLTSFDPTVSGDCPAPGILKLGPTDTFAARTGLSPALSSSATENQFTITYADHNDPQNLPATLDLLATFVVLDSPGSDQASVVNQVRATQQTTNAPDVVLDGAAHFTLTEPILRIAKGVVAVNNAQAVFSPSTVGPVSFSAPGTASPRFSGTIHSTNLATTPINSNVSRVDAADLVTFALVIENTGTGLHGAFDVCVRDELPAGFSIPAGGLNLSVTDGAGNPLAYIDQSGGLFGSGIELTDGPSAGALAAYDAANGRNIVVLTYDLELQASSVSGDVLQNTATLFHYTATEGGTDHTPSDLVEAASTTIATPTAVKSTPQTQAVIGGVVTFNLTVTVPEGTTPALSIVDTLDSGLAFVQLTAVTTSDPTDVSWTLPVDPVVAPGGQTVTIDLGTVVNADQDNAAPETLTVTYTAVVLNVLANQQGTTLNNSAVVSWTGGWLPAVSSSEIGVIEPNLTLATTRTVGGSGTVGDAGDAVLYVITVRNISGVAAYDVAFTDNLAMRAGVGSLIVAPSFTVTDPLGPVTAGNFELIGDDTNGWTLQTRAGAEFDMPYSAARTITIRVYGTLAAIVRPYETIVHTAQTRFSSLDGDPGAISPHNADSTERTGADGPGAGLNNYAVNSAVNITTFALTTTNLLATTSEASTSGTSVLVGEIARYRLTTRLAEGIAPLYQMFNSLPTGLRMLKDGTATVALVSNGTGITSSTLAGPGLAMTGNEATVASLVPTFVIPSTAIAPATFGSGTDPTFNLGTLTNNDRDTDQEFVVLEFNVLVENVAANQLGTVLNSRGRAQLSGVLTAGYSAYVGVVVAEPAITDFAKTADPTSGDAGDLISYRITFTNSAAANTATAFDLQLTDVLPARLALNVGSVVVTVTGATNVVNNSAGNTVAVAIGSLAPGGTVQIDCNAELLGTVQPEQLVTNTASLSFSSLPLNGTAPNPTGSTVPGAAGSVTGERTGSGGVNDHSRSDTASVTVTEPDFSKVMLATNQSFTAGGDVTIGEHVEYMLSFTIVEGITYGVSVVDDFPEGLALVSLDSIIFSPTLETSAAGGFAGALANALVPPGGHSVTVNFETITNSDTDNETTEIIRITFTAVVLNVNANQHGIDLVNSATVFYSTGDVTTVAPAARVVEPVLNVDASASAAEEDAGGAVITYTIAVSYDEASTADAFEVVVEDVLPAGLDYAPGSLVLLDGVIPDLLVEADGTITASYALFPPGSVSRFAYGAAFNGSTTPGEVVTNVAQVRYTSLPGNATTPTSPYNARSTERTGSPSDPGGLVNDNVDLASVPVAVRSNSMAGYVFVDQANDAVRDLDDPAVADVTLTLTGTDNLGQPVNRTTTTGVGGDFTFSNLRPGAYRLEETQPAGHLDGLDTVGSQGGTGANDRFDFALALGTTTTGIDNNFGELLPARVSGAVYEDLNNDGTLEPGEPGIASVALQLQGRDDLGAAVDRLVETDSAGVFSFDGLRPGVYTLSQSQPSGYLDGRDTNGTQGGALGNDVISDFTLASDIHGADNWFGELPPAALSGTVYEDRDEDAVIDAGEDGIADVTVTLDGIDDLGNVVHRTLTTSTEGHFLFDTLRPGTYQLTETQPSAPFYFDGLDTVGSLGGVPDNDAFSVIPLAAAQTGAGYLFGELPPVDPVGYVFVDVNDNGARDAGEPPVPGTQITVTGIDDLGQTVTLTDTTDANGFYQFAFLRRGTYAIAESQPLGYLDGQEQNGTPPAVMSNDLFEGLALDWGQFAGDYNFGEVAFGSLAGHVYVDTNHNGGFDEAEMRLSGVTITLTGTDLGNNPIVRNTTTDSTGGYQFNDLLPGTYRLTQTQPANYVDGPDQPGNLGGTPLLPDAVDQIFLGPNAEGLGYDFGENGLSLDQITKQYFLARNRLL